MTPDYIDPKSTPKPEYVPAADGLENVWPAWKRDQPIEYQRPPNREHNPYHRPEDR